MTNNNEKIYFQALTKATEKILSKLADKIRSIEEKISRLEKIEELPKFKEVLSELKILSQDISNLKLLNEKERENLTTQILNVQKILSEFDKKIFENEKSSSATKEFFNNSLKEVLKELEKIKEKINKYEKEISLFREGLLKSPGIIGPSASGIEVFINNTKKNVYSKLNFIEGNNITFEFSENKQEGRANIKINSSGSTTDAIIYAIALG
jgi:DNA mismatch repair ATPase MutS